MLHINDIRNYLNCPYAYLYSLDKSNRTEHIAHLNVSESLFSLIIKKMHLDKYFTGNTGDDYIKTRKAMEEYDVLLYARFEYLGLRVNIPLMIRNEGGWDIYFARMELYPKESFAQQLADTIWVLKQLNIEIKDYYYLHLNPDYIREDKLDYDALMVVDDSLYSANNKKVITIKEALKKKERSLEEVIYEINDLKPENLELKKRTSVCTRGTKCPYYDLCWPNEAIQPDNSILHLVSSHYKYQMYDEGLTSLKQTDTNRFEGMKTQYAQIMADINDGLYYDKLNLKAYYQKYIKYPLSFLDFEWDTYPIPPYEKMRPFDISMWQYSLHVLKDENSELEHYEFIGENDCRKQLLESLFNDLPKEGSIVTYNGFGSDLLQLLKLKDVYPEYADKIDDISERMIDFSLLFTNGMIYHLKMRGLYSLKQVTEIFGSENSYHNLEVAKAMNAVENWREMCKTDDIIKKKEIRNNLSLYCGQDTYSLYLIYRWIKDLSGE